MFIWFLCKSPSLKIQIQDFQKQISKHLDERNMYITYQILSIDHHDDHVYLLYMLLLAVRSDSKS